MSGSSRPLILLDRDGVLNRVVIDPEHGTIDSPLHPSQVELLPGVADALAQLTSQGYGVAVVSNQPAAAKGKTTRANLEAAHERVLELAQAAGGRVLSSHLCFHRAEDGCACRKPKTGLLEQAFSANPGFDRSLSWMVGDGVTDVEAGVRFGLKTAFLGPRKCDACRIFDDRSLKPAFWGSSLTDFVTRLSNQQD